MRLYSLTVWLLVVAVQTATPLGFKFGIVTAPTKTVCEASRADTLKKHPDASLIIDCEPHRFELPGRDA